ncbi:hypothetical protein L7F22_037388 [Adiantum nelumboides]|nr:hypothetical protein [Adiantum nelumboides]
MPKHLTDEDLPPDQSHDQWLTVFKVPKKKCKVFLYMVHDHLYNACCLLYLKIYQAIPSNVEIMTKFARALSTINYAVAKTNPKSHKTAWTVVGGMILDNVKAQKGGLNKKVMKFMTNLYVRVLPGQMDFDVDSYVPTASNLPLEHI